MSTEPLLTWAARVLALACEKARNGEPVAVVSEPAPLPQPVAAALARAGGDPFDAAVVGLALAAELDPGAGRAVAYLHGDAVRCRPSADLLARLCCPDVDDWAAGIARLVADAPLAERGFVEITADGVLAEVRPGVPLVRHTLGLTEPPPSLAGLGPAVALEVAAHDRVVAAWANAPSDTVLHVHGAAADVLTGRVAAALLAAGTAAIGVQLAGLDAASAPAIAAESLLRGLPAILVLPPAGHGSLGRLLRSIDAVCVVDPAHALAQTPELLAGRRVISAALGSLDVTERADAIRAALDRRGISLAGAVTELAFARRYRLGPAGIDRVAAVTAADLHARQRPVAASDDLTVAAASMSGGALRDLATRVDRGARWTDLAVPELVLGQLQELCARVDVRDIVRDEWGYGTTIADARGVSALFVGPSGAGKTLAASVVAGELGLALYRVDLARVVSKYIGETERNLDAVFAAAEATDVVLLFDEADALFGRRSEVQDAHDRYANLEVAYLLQRMETYDGVAILSTNLLRNLDDAFTRRLDFRVLFPFPGVEERRAIWRLVWPSADRLDKDVDLDALADEHELAGGTIRNAALAAAHLAAAEGAAVGQRHLEHAVMREHEKLGRLPRLLTGVDG